MVRLERWVTIVTLVLLQALAIAIGLIQVRYPLDFQSIPGQRLPLAVREPAVTAAPVLAPVDEGRPPVQATLAARLSDAVRDPRLGSSVAAVVMDPLSGKSLFAERADDQATPASTTKVVTAVAALSALGPDATLSTRVVNGPGPGSIVLVGGGDPTLAGAQAKPAYPQPARLSDLAKRTAVTLKAAGTTQVTLAFDDSLYTGPRTGPGWKPGYIPEGSVAPIAALAVDEGRIDPEEPDRVDDPSRTAATAFAGLLAKQGIDVAKKITPGRGTGAEVARVESPPISALVEHMLTVSDNDLAEALARQIAIKEGKPASFQGGAVAVQQVLKRLKAADGVEVNDGSGLSTRNRLTPSALARLLALAAEPDRPELHAAISGLPVAGFTGTLGERYEPGQAGAGTVRAKTGTLDGVSTLAGVAYTNDGRLLAFAFLADHANPGAPAALDRLAGIVAACGCR